MEVTIDKEFAKKVRSVLRRHKNGAEVSLWFFRELNEVVCEVRGYNEIITTLTQYGGVENTGTCDIVLPLKANDYALDVLLKEPCSLAPYKNYRPRVTITNKDGVHYQEECIEIHSMKSNKTIAIIDLVTCNGAGTYGMLKYNDAKEMDHA